MKIEIDSVDLLKLQNENRELHERIFNLSKQVELYSEENIDNRIGILVNESISRAFEKVLSTMGFSRPFDDMWFTVDYNWNNWHKDKYKIEVKPQAHFYDDVKIFVIKALVTKDPEKP